MIFCLLITLTVALWSSLLLPRETSAEAGSTASVSFLRSKQTSALSLSAQSAVLIEAESGTVLYEKNATKRLPMASTTKVMTALVVLESAKLDKKVKIPKEACGIEGSSVYLREGEEFSVEELLYALMLASANDAATALAIEVCGSVDAFAERMNQKAAELGLEGTHFTNPHGLHNEDHYTTAKDLASIAAEASRNETFRKICSTQKTVIRRDSKENARLLVNHNKLLTRYSGCFGIKTGFTKTSGRCLVSGAERDGLSLIAVTLGAPDDWNDHETLLDYGFSLYSKKTLAEAGELSFSLPIVGGYQRSVLCANAEKVCAVLPNDADEVRTVIEMRRFELAPVYAGEVVGTVYFMCGEKVIAKVDIIAFYSAQKR